MRADTVDSGAVILDTGCWIEKDEPLKFIQNPGTSIQYPPVIASRVI